MKIIKPSVEFITPFNSEAVLKRIEECGRTAYQSLDKAGDNTAEGFVRMLIALGHESVLEHVSFSVRIICDRGVSHELVRHRLASYTQESTRYCNYSKGKFGSEITVIEPCFLHPATRLYKLWEDGCSEAEQHYFEMLNEGATAQEARTVLPNSLKTEVVMTANAREWRHFLRLRCAPAAHPQMREVANMMLEQFHENIPALFDDIWEEYERGWKQC